MIECVPGFYSLFGFLFQLFQKFSIQLINSLQTIEIQPTFTCKILLLLFMYCQKVQCSTNVCSMNISIVNAFHNNEHKQSLSANKMKVLEKGGRERESCSSFDPVRNQIVAHQFVARKKSNNHESLLADLSYSFCMVSFGWKCFCMHVSHVSKQFTKRWFIFLLSVGDFIMSNMEQTYSLLNVFGTFVVKYICDWKENRTTNFYRKRIPSKQHAFQP